MSQSRIEFSGKTRDQAIQRAKGHCEKCGMPFAGKKPEVDHILPAALGGGIGLSNAQVLCQPCHREKTTQDVRGIRKADRVRKAHTGAKKPPAKPIQSRGFARKERNPKPSLPPRPMYE